MSEQRDRIIAATKAAAKKRDKFGEGRVVRLQAALAKASEDVQAELSRFEAKVGLEPWQTMRVALIKDLQGEIEKIGKELTKTWNVGTVPDVEAALKLGIEDGLGQLAAGQAGPFKDLSDVAKNAMVKQTFTTIDRSAVQFLANYDMQLLGDVSTTLTNKIQTTIQAGILSGKSIRKVAAEIGQVVPDKEGFRTAGKTVFSSANHRATLIARTETLRAHNEGRKTFYDQVGVTKMEWITAEDERTCPVCAPMNGKVYDIKGDVTAPLHPACRCSVCASFDDDTDIHLPVELQQPEEQTPAPTP